MYFFLRTNNPRPTFNEDMTPAERERIEAHVAYWTERARERISIVFGPVADPAGFFGIAVCRAPDEDTMRRLVKADPANGLLEYEITPMVAAVIGHEVQ
jgi:hypothetical protein